MTASGELLEEFETLQDADRAEVLAELLRRVALAPHDLPDADDLTAAAAAAETWPLAGRWNLTH